MTPEPRPHEGAISCREFVELVTAYLDGSLDDDTIALVEDHLDLCHPCIVYLDQMRQTVATLNQLPFDTLPTTAKDDLVATFRAARGA